MHNGTNGKEEKLGLVALSALVVSAMVGGGVFNLTSDMAKVAGVDAIVWAWLITGVGMCALSLSFRKLALLKPEVTKGIFGYAEMGFGKFTGFLMAWGYWLSAVFANVTYAVLVMQTMNSFFPGHFQGPWALAGGSLFIWGVCLLMLLGAREVGIVNLIGTIAKMVPLLAFLLVVGGIAMGLLTSEGTGTLASTALTKSAPALQEGLLAQIKSTMMVTLWVFIGIEGAVAISGRAKKLGDVGKATLLGFGFSLLLYIAVSLLPFLVFARPELATIGHPTMSLLMQAMLGEWGLWGMNAGLLVSVLAAWTAWTLIVIQTPFAAAEDKLFPKIFLKKNRREVPIFSLIASTLVMQLCLVLVTYAENAWHLMLTITGVTIMPPYLFSALYLLKVAGEKDGRLLGKGWWIPGKASRMVWSLALVAVLYSLWLIFAAKVFYLVLGAVVFMLGIPVFIKARREQNGVRFGFSGRGEWLLAITLVVVGVWSVCYLVARGSI